MHSPTPFRWIFGALLLVPLALPAQQVPAGATPSAAVEGFMQAIADSNLTRVAQLFGTSDGSSWRTHHPKDFEKRVLAMQLFLRHIKARTLGEVPATKGNDRTVTTELSHGECRVTISIVTSKASEGWVVRSFDLDRAAQVNQPCARNRQPGN